MNSSPLLGHHSASRRTLSIFGSVEFPCGITEAKMWRLRC